MQFLWHYDQTKIALIYSPIDERLYYAEQGRGAYVFSAYHSARIKVSNIKDDFEATVAYNTPDARPLIGDVRRTGCPALDLAWVAAGKLDAFVSEPLDFAEIAAGDLIVREAGGKIEMMADLVATNGKIEL